MPTTLFLSCESDLKSCVESIRKVLKREGHCSVAFSSGGMKCEDFALRGLPQNALFHTWLRETAEYTFKSKCSEIEVESMKRYVKTRCYSDTKQKWLIRKLINPETKETKVDFTSSSTWSKGEMTFFLDWMQAFFAEQNLILEARGEYVELTEAQNT